MKRMGSVLGLLLVGLCSCGEGGMTDGQDAAIDAADDAPVDYAAWKSQLEEVPGNPPIHQFRRTVVQIIDELCQTSVDDFTKIIRGEVIPQGGEKFIRISISYACPERMDELDAVMR